MAKKKVKKNIAVLLNSGSVTTNSHVEEAANNETETVETPPTHPAMQAYIHDNEED